MISNDVTHVLTRLSMTSHTYWHGYQWRHTCVDMVTKMLHTCWHGYQWRYTRVDTVTNDVTHVLTRLSLSHMCWHGYQEVKHVLTWLPMTLRTCWHGYQWRHTCVDKVIIVTHVLTWLPRSYTRVDMVANSIIHVFQWHPTRVAVVKLSKCRHGYQ
jgi:hypothetical protein